MPEFQREAVNGQLFICAQVYSPDESRRLIAQALIDTGATQSSLSPEFATKLGLQPERVGWVQGLSTKQARYYTCLVRLRSPVHPHEDYGSTRKIDLEVHDALGDSAPFDMLLGMDALMRYRFVHLDGSMLTIDDGD